MKFNHKLHKRVSQLLTDRGYTILSSGFKEYKVRDSDFDVGYAIIELNDLNNKIKIHFQLLKTNPIYADFN